MRVAPTPELVEAFAEVAPGGMRNPAVLFQGLAEPVGQNIHGAGPGGLQLGIALRVRGVLVEAAWRFRVPARKTRHSRRKAEVNGAEPP